jgi:CBS domain-containing protein
MLVAEAMTSHPVTLTPSATAKTAAASMRENGIGDVLVCDRSGHVQGIVTDRDIATRVAAEGRRPTAKLKDICTTEPVTISASAGLEQAVQVMCENAIRRLPVVDKDDKVVGVISLGDAAMKLDDHSVLADISRAPANN